MNLCKVLCFIIIMFCAVTGRSENIAFIGAFSGTDPNTSNELYKGIQLYLTNNPSVQKKINIVKFDNKGTIDGTIKAFSNIIDKKIKIVIGIANSDEAIVASRIAEKNKIIFLTPFATNPKVTELKNYTYRLCYDDIVQGEILAKFTVKELKERKVTVLINSTSSYSVGLSNAFIDRLKILKVKESEIDIIKYSPTQLSSESWMNKLSDVKTKLVFIPDHIIRSSLIVEYMSKTGKYTFLGGDGFGGKKVFSDLVKYIGESKVYYSTHWHGDIANNVSRQFVRLYKKNYPLDEPTSGAALTYDLGLVLEIALKSKSIDDFRGMLNGRDFDGVTGRFNFNQKNTPYRPVVILKYENGVHKFLKLYN